MSQLGIKPKPDIEWITRPAWVVSARSTSLRARGRARAEANGVKVERWEWWSFDVGMESRRQQISMASEGERIPNGQRDNSLE